MYALASQSVIEARMLDWCFPASSVSLGCRFTVVSAATSDLVLSISFTLHKLGKLNGAGVVRQH